MVRLRAVAGRDAGALAPFAAAAVAEQEAVAGLVAALLALTRAPRVGEHGTDVGEVCMHVARLLGPVVRHDGVQLEVTAHDRSIRTAAPALAVRLAVCAVLDLAAEAARNMCASGDRSVAVRCTVLAGANPTLVVAPAPATWPDDTLRVLSTWAVRVMPDADGVRLVFPAP